MIRFVVAIGLASYLALGPGTAPTFKGTACSQRCSNDDPDGNCPPDCGDCVCCPHLRVMTIASDMKLPVPGGVSVVPERVMTVPPSPEPGEIMHVPKNLLA